MLYFDWFTAVRSLVFPQKPSPRGLSKVEQRSLEFLGNMFMPEETHVLRMGAGTPKDFSLQTPILGSRPELYGSGFYLPSTGVVVEDEISLTGYVDLERAGQRRGLDVQRVFLYVEDISKRPTTENCKSLKEFLASLECHLIYPPGTMMTIWGVIENVRNMNVERKPFRIEMSTWGYSVFNQQEVLDNGLSTWFEASIVHRTQNRLPDPGPVIDKLMAQVGQSLAENLHFGLLQVAYHNAIMEAQK